LTKDNREKQETETTSCKWTTNCKSTTSSSSE